MDGNGQPCPTHSGGDVTDAPRQPLLTVSRPLVSLTLASADRETGHRYHLATDTMMHARERHTAAGDAPPPELG
jgi:hypothetical protein